MELSKTLGELKASGYKSMSIKDEMRKNLIGILKNGEQSFAAVIDGPGFRERCISQTGLILSSIEP